MGAQEQLSRLILLHVHHGLSVFRLLPRAARNLSHRDTSRTFVPVVLRSYFRYFGVDEVKWMAVNGALSIFAMYSDVNSLLYHFGVSMSDYHWYVHIMPFTYIVMFTFLPRQVLLEIAHAREDEQRKERVSRRYAWGTFAFHTVLLIWGRASGPS